MNKPVDEIKNLSAGFDYTKEALTSAKRLLHFAD